MNRILIAFLMVIASTFVAAPSAAQTGETYEEIIADPSLTADHAVVVRLYQAVFAREPDPIGLRYWLDQYDTGEWSTRRIANFFATGDEFIGLYGETDNQAFMTAVYSNVLGRQPDQTGGAFWTDQLDDGMGRAEMILLISNAPEFIDVNLILADSEAEDGLQFDYGEIERVEVVGGVTWIWFDRWSFGTFANGVSGTIEGVEHTQEPRYELASDWHGGMNVNPRQRRFPLAPDAVVLEIEPAAFDTVCAGDNVIGEFVATDITTLLDRGLESLTFNPQGEVTLVRDQRGC